VVRGNVTFIFIPPGLKVMGVGWILFPDGTPGQDGMLFTAGFMYYYFSTNLPHPVCPRIKKH
jgi:hypothetical protein